MAFRKVLLCAVVILIVLVPLSPGFDKVGMPMDEGSLLVYPELILKGQLPYRDFETFYGPANLWALSATYAIFSPNVFVERSVGLVYRILILVAVFLIGQRWNNLLASGCTLLAGVFLLPCLLPAHAWFGALMCALLSIWLLAQGKSKWCLLGAGFLGGAALMFRQDLAPAISLSAVPLLLLAAKRCRLSYVCGLLLALLPLVGLTIAAGPREIFNNLFLFPVLYSSPGRHLPFLSAESPVRSLFFIHLLAAIANVTVGALAVWRNGTNTQSRLLLSLGLFGLGLTHQAFQRLDLLHVLYVDLVSVSVLPLAIFTALQWKTGEATASMRDAALAVAVVMIFIGIPAPQVSFYFRNELEAAINGGLPKSVFVSLHDRSFPVPDEEVAITLARMLKRLDVVTTRGERLFVGPADLRRTNCNDTFIYHMLPDLQPASYFLEMNPGSANRLNSRLASDIASADWLILDRALDITNEQNESAKFASDRPMKVIDQRFQLVGKMGQWQIYRKKVAASL
jgi:hypothetical protein